MVSGSMSTRGITGPNVNRGWVTMTLSLPVETSATSPAMLAVGAGLMLVAAGYILRRSARG